MRICGRKGMAFSPAFFYVTRTNYTKKTTCFRHLATGIIPLVFQDDQALSLT